MRRATLVLLGLSLLIMPAVVTAAQSAAPTGKVVITYAVTRIFQFASNQVAVWIEDEKGVFVRTVYVSNFAGKRAGWKARPQTLQAWVKASNAAGTPQAEIDAVSGPTPGTGAASVTWRLLDRSGKNVPAGTYRYRVEGNISFEKAVLWTGVIKVGGAGSSSHAVAAYSPADAGLAGKLITSASAEFLPGQ